LKSDAPDTPDTQTTPPTPVIPPVLSPELEKQWEQVLEQANSGIRNLTPEEVDDLRERFVQEHAPKPTGDSPAPDTTTDPTAPDGTRPIPGGHRPDAAVIDVFDEGSPALDPRVTTTAGNLGAEDHTIQTGNEDFRTAEERGEVPAAAAAGGASSAVADPFDDDITGAGAVADAVGAGAPATGIQTAPPPQNTGIVPPDMTIPDVDSTPAVGAEDDMDRIQDETAIPDYLQPEPDHIEPEPEPDDPGFDSDFDATTL
jgi:hypothetical protein